MSQIDNRKHYPPPPPRSSEAEQRRLVLPAPYVDHVKRGKPEPAVEAPAPFNPEQLEASLLDRLRAIEAMERRLEENARELQEREAFVRQAEDELERKARELSEREASIEHREEMG